MKLFLRQVSPVLITLALTACGDSGTEIGAPLVSPPLNEALPAALRTTAAVTLAPQGSPLAMSTALTCGGSETSIRDTVLQRLFCDGPTKILSLTDSIDSRMDEINTRSLESLHECLSAANIDKSSSFAFPAQITSNAFTQKFKCKDVFSEGSGLMAFGNDETNWWLSQGGTGDTLNNGITQAWRVTLASDGTVASEEAYITIAPKASGGSLAGSSMLLHLLVDSTADTVEATAAGGGIGFKHFHFRSNATHVWVSGVREGQISTEEVCLDATTLSNSTGGLSDCASLESGLALTALGRQAYSDGGLGASGAENVDMSALINLILTEATVSDVTAF